MTDWWHHVVAIKDCNEFQLNFNGNLEAVLIGNANCNNLHLATDIGDLLIGNRYKGKIDDVFIYDRALSAAEVADLYELTACCE